MGAKIVELEPDHRVAALAARQRGVISRAQLIAAGSSAKAIEHRIRTSRLHRIHRGVFAAGHRHLDREGRWWAAVLACGEGAVLSHASAAAAWDLRPTTASRIDVSVPTKGGRIQQPGLRIHRLASLTSEDIAPSMPPFPPLTTPSRTLLDLAATLPRQRLARILERAEALRLLDAAELARLTSRRLPGSAAVDALLTDGVDLTVTLTANGLEDAFLGLCADHGLPRPLVNHPVGRFKADFLWTHHRLIAETDGRETHGTRAAFERDRARDAELLTRGYRTVRFTYRQVVHAPHQIATILTGLLIA